MAINGVTPAATACYGRGKRIRTPMMNAFLRPALTISAETEGTDTIQYKKYRRKMVVDAPPLFLDLSPLEYVVTALITIAVLAGNFALAKMINNHRKNGKNND